MFSSKPKITKLSEEQLAESYKDKKFLIIGGTAGIGKALAQSLLKRGAEVIIVGRRDPDESLRRAKFVKKDLSIMKNAVELAKEVEQESLDVVVFTNGIITASTRQESPDGLELDLAVSYLSRFAFANKLDKLGSKRKSNAKAKPRIFVMGYPGQKTEIELDDFNSEKSYTPFPAHMRTVVGNEALVTYLQTNMSGVNVYGLNPGLIKTEIRDNYLGKGSWTSAVIETLIGWFNQSAEQYAENVLIHALVSPELEEKPKSLLDNYGSFLDSNPFLTKENYNRVIKESQTLLDKALAKK